MATTGATKRFFRTPSAARIRKLERIADDARRTRPEIAALIDSMTPQQYYEIGHEEHPAFVPATYAGGARFKKHAPTLHLEDAVARASEGVRQAILGARTEEPTEDERSANVANGFSTSLLCGYSYAGLAPDRRNVVVPLTELCKAAKLYTYHDRATVRPIVQEVYDDARNVPYQGVAAKTTVSSRRQKIGRHHLFLRSVPVVQNGASARLWRGIKATDDMTLASEYRHTRFTRPGKESNERYFVHAPEIVAYWALCDYYLHGGRTAADRDGGNTGTRNTVPLEQNPYLVPSHRLLAFFEKLERNVVIQHLNPHQRVTWRVLNDAEREILLGGWVKRNGYDAAFGYRKGEKLDTYRWSAEEGMRIRRRAEEQIKRNKGRGIKGREREEE